MSIYIKNMEMPKSRGEYVFLLYVDSDGTATVEGAHSILKGEPFEAVPVPPHGRLIDADALHELFEYKWYYLQVLNWNGNPTTKARQSGINWCISTMRDFAPTIIQADPAEEGET